LTISGRLRSLRMRLVKDASLHELVNGYDPVGFGWRGFFEYFASLFRFFIGGLINL